MDLVRCFVEGPSFSKGCLTRNYSQSMTVEEALDHPWWGGYHLGFQLFRNVCLGKDAPPSTVGGGGVKGARPYHWVLSVMQR